MDYEKVRNILDEYYARMGAIMMEISQYRVELEKMVDKYDKLSYKIEEITADVKTAEDKLSLVQQELIDKVKTIIEKK